MMKKMVAIILSALLCVSLFAVPAAAHGNDNRGQKLSIALGFSFGNESGHNYYLYENEPDTVYFDFTGRSYDFDDVENDENARAYKYSLECEKKNNNANNFFNRENIVIGDKVTYLGNNFFADYYKVSNIYVPDSVTEIGTNVFPSQTDAIIHCGKNSPAIKGALEAGLRFDTNGQTHKADVNGDGDINLLDLVAMRKALAKWHSGYEVTAIDANGDGKVNLLDLVLLRKFLAKWAHAIAIINGRPETPDVIETPDVFETPDVCTKPDDCEKPDKPEKPNKPNKPSWPSWPNDFEDLTEPQEPSDNPDPFVPDDFDDEDEDSEEENHCQGEFPYGFGGFGGLAVHHK